jgi:TetR/AcrR family transcriptional repressor of nem operon
VDLVQPIHPTKQRLLSEGMSLLLAHGYSDLGIQGILSATGVPKGSFYHHFKDKEDFALQVLDAYMEEVHRGLDACLGDRSRLPLERIRLFFETTARAYASQGYLGCLMGSLGQELSGVNPVFRRRIDDCFGQISRRLAECLGEARQRGDLPSGTDLAQRAALLVDCWEGAALRSRLQRDDAPLKAMLDFFLGALVRS